MSKKAVWWFAAMASLPLQAGAQSAVLSFDDIAVPSTGAMFALMPSTYDGFTWSGFGVQNAVALSAAYGYNGYRETMQTRSNVAFNVSGDQAQMVVAAGNTFSFQSGYFGAAWTDGLRLTITGWRSGVEVDATTVTLNVDSPNLVTLNWSGLDTLKFFSTGGTRDPHVGGMGEEFALDNASVDVIPITPVVIPTPTPSPVPEPASVATLSLGLVLLAGVARRRARQS